MRSAWKRYNWMYVVCSRQYVLNCFLKQLHSSGNPTPAVGSTCNWDPIGSFQVPGPGTGSYQDVCLIWTRRMRLPIRIVGGGWQSGIGGGERGGAKKLKLERGLVLGVSSGGRLFSIGNVAIARSTVGSVRSCAFWMLPVALNNLWLVLECVWRSRSRWQCGSGCVQSLHWSMDGITICSV